MKQDLSFERSCFFLSVNRVFRKVTLSPLYFDKYVNSDIHFKIIGIYKWLQRRRR